MTLALRVLAAFLIGSIPFAKIAMLGTGIDITKVGSNNPGFNNVLRVSSKWRAAIALIGDIAKGLPGGVAARYALARRHCAGDRPLLESVAAIQRR